MKAVVTFIAALLMLPPAFGQDDQLPGEEELEEIRRYSVEVIIFAYAEDVSVGSEVFVPDLPEIVEEPLPEEGEEIIFDDQTMTEVEPEEPAEPEEPEVPEEQLVILQKEELTLTAVLERLERLDAYEPLMHFGWTQPTYPQEETEAIELSELDAPPPGLNGQLMLYLGRYLHLVVNLALDEQPASAPDPDPADSDDGLEDPGYRYDEETPYSFGDDRLLSDVMIEPINGFVRFRIDEDRIIRNGEIRYFDHPKFGVIAKVTRIEEEELEEDPDDAGAGLDELVGRSRQ